MKRLEDALPRDISFDAAVEELWDSMEELFESNLSETGDILDIEKELDSDFLQMWRLSGHLAGALISENEDKGAVHRAVYRGMCFGLQVIDEVKSSPIRTLQPSSVLTAEGVAPETEILSQTSQYLADREHIDNLIGRYMPDIDPTFRYHHYIDTGASLMLMLAERQQAEEILAVEANDLTPEMFNDPS